MMINNGAHGKSTLVKSNKQMLREAGAMILKYEQEAKEGVAAIEELKWMCARQRVAIMALGKHFNLTPDEMKAIVQPVFDEQLAETQKEIEAVKDKFKADVAAGKMPEFTVIENEDKGGEPAKGG